MLLMIRFNKIFCQGNSKYEYIYFTTNFVLGFLSQVDYYGIAGTIHCLMFGKYMKVYQEGGIWKMTSKFSRFVLISLKIKKDSHAYITQQKGAQVR